jgi:hypothetical protein
VIAMMPDPDKPEELSADEVLVELQGAGITTLKNLQEMIAAHRVANEQTDRRRQPHPLLGLTPDFMDEDVPRRAAQRGELDAWRIGGRWFSCIEAMESWLTRTDRFKNKEAEERWLKMIAHRFP